MNTTTNNETAKNTFSTIETPTYVFTFTAWQLAVLAAIETGCESAAEIREYLDAQTAADNVEQAGASFRRKTYETIAVLAECGLVRSERVGRYRTVELLEEAASYVRDVLASAGLGEFGRIS